MSEWKVFSALAVEWLGMPVEAMPFYSSSALIRWKVRRILLGFVMETGSFGHNRDMSYYNRYPYLIRKAISLWRDFEGALPNINRDFFSWDGGNSFASKLE